MDDNVKESGFLVNMSYLMIMNDDLFLIDDIEWMYDINKDYNKS